MFRSQALLNLSKRLLLAGFLSLLFLSYTACEKASNVTKEVAYVNAPQVFLRDRLSTIYDKKGTVKLGDKVYVLSRQKRFAQVRTERGEEGWIADRYLISSDEYAQFQKLETENVKTPVISKGVARSALNLHLSPGRDTEHLFQLKDADKVEILKRATAEKPQRMQTTVKKTAGKAEEPTGPALEDWSLVRSSEGRVGWVLARMIDIDVPLDIAQYAEGQRIVSSAVLNEVQDGEKKVPQYLVVLTDNKDGLPFDFNQIRIFSWNLKRHRYETAYRERNLVGVFPVKTGSEDFGKEGVEPTFTIRVKNEQGQESERKYRMIGPIVRRVATPEELKAEAAERAARRAAEPKKSGKKKRK